MQKRREGGGGGGWKEEATSGGVRNGGCRSLGSAIVKLITPRNCLN